MKRLLALILALSMMFALCGCASSDYKKAQELLEKRQYSDAAELFKKLGDYKDSKVKLCEALIHKIGFLSTFDPSYSDIIKAEEALEVYNSLSDEEKSAVSNKSDLPTQDEINELREIRQRKDAEEIIEKAVLEDAVKTIRSYLKNPSSYQERTDMQSRAYVLWDEDDPTKVHGVVNIYYSALNDFGGRIDSSVSGVWNGTYKNGIFTLESSSIGTSMLLEALR